MIVSYTAIHHDLEDPVGAAFETSRAALIKRRAHARGVSTRMNHDGDTSYLETYIHLPSLETVSPEDPGQYPAMSDADDGLWSSYTEFLMELEDSNLGYLWHEAETISEKVLLEELRDTGDDSPSLACVEVEYRHVLGADTAPNSD